MEFRCAVQHDKQFTRFECEERKRIWANAHARSFMDALISSGNINKTLHCLSCMYQKIVTDSILSSNKIFQSKSTFQPETETKISAKTSIKFRPKNNEHTFVSNGSIYRPTMSIQRQCQWNYCCGCCSNKPNLSNVDIAHDYA